MSELWRRGVVRPHLLETTAFDENTPVDHLSIDDALFSGLWDSGLFQDLNVACGSLIDDYEEEAVTGDDLVAGLAVVRRHAESQSSDPAIAHFARSLSTLMQTTIDSGTAVYFIL